MFKVYLRHPDLSVYDRFTTEIPDEAITQFETLTNDPQYDGKKIAIVMSYNNQQLAFHRCDKPEGHAQNYRGRISEIDMPSRRTGRPTVYGGVRKNIYISPELWGAAQSIGNGNASSGIQTALKYYTDRVNTGVDAIPSQTEQKKSQPE